MTHIVTEACIKCKNTECVDVCPVDCFRDTPLMLVIDPDECIDCGVCVQECPVNAIYAEEDAPEDQQEFVKINAFFSNVTEIQSISKRIQPLINSEDWIQVKNKKQFLSLDLSSLQDSLQDSDINLKVYALKNLTALTSAQFELALIDPEPAVRKAVAKRKDFFPNSNQLTRGLQDGNAEVRGIFFGMDNVHLSENQVELGLHDVSEDVRCTTLKSNFIPSLKQFLKYATAQAQTEQELMWKKLNRSIFDAILENPDDSILIKAIERFKEPLLMNDVYKLLNNENPEIIFKTIDHSINHSQDFALNSDQIDDCLSHPDEALRLKLLDKYANQLTPGQVDQCLQDNSEKIRRIAIGLKKQSLTSEQVEIALTDKFEIVRIEVLRKKQLTFNSDQIDRALNDESDEIKLAIVRNNKIKLTPNQVDFLVANASEVVLIELFSKKHLIISEAQYDYININCSIFVRRKMLEKISFTLSTKQILQGLADKSVNIRYDFRKFIPMLDKKTLMNSSIQGYSSITSEFTDTVEDTLNRIHNLLTWTAEKKALLDKLILQLKKENYHTFSMDRRMALVINLGDSCFYDVPLKKRGGLSRFSGERVKLVCIGHGTYSSVVIAAQKLRNGALV